MSQIAVQVDKFSLGAIAEELGIKPISLPSDEMNNFRRRVGIEILVPPKTKLLLWSSVPVSPIAGNPHPTDILSPFVTGSAIRL